MEALYTGIVRIQRAFLISHASPDWHSTTRRSEGNREHGYCHRRSKAIGASHWQVIRQFWGEVLALSTVAALIAVGLLVTLGPVIANAFNGSIPTSAATNPVRSGGGPFGGGRFLFASQSTNLTVHLSSATLTAQTLLIIVGLGMGLVVLTSVIPAWYVARIKPAEVLRRL